MTPGNIPASANPRRALTAYMPPLFDTGTWQSKAIPHEIMIRDCHVLGENRLSTRLDGASNTM